MLARILTARLARSFVLVPAVIGIVGILTAMGTIVAGESLHGWVLLLFPAPGPETMRAVLGTIAGASLTVLSLVYSLTLVVFTLAAGNIGPRLLVRFTEDSTIQITAGALAATFFYSILILQRADTGIDPALATGVAIVWAVLSITLVIVFIHTVATRITIDEEIARIGVTLSRHIETLLSDATEGKVVEPPRIEEVRPTEPPTDVTSKRSGYVDAIDLDRLYRIACAENVFIEVKAVPGQFVVAGSPLFSVWGTLAGSRRTAARETFMIARSRTPEADLDFSILLMVEIAQRALSPGINDGFTAIAVIDHLSAAFSRILVRQVPSPLRSDEEGRPRLWCRIVSVDRLLGTAFHPLRRDSLPNVTVALRLVAALERLAVVAHAGYGECLREHVDLIETDVQRLDLNDADACELTAACGRVRDILAGKRQSHDRRGEPAAGSGRGDGSAGGE